MHQHHHGHPIDDGQDHLAANLGGGQQLEAVGHLGVELLGQLLGNGTEDLHGTQRGDEGRQLAVGDQAAVHFTEHHAQYQHQNDGDDVRAHAGDADLGQQAVRGRDEIHQHRAQRAHHGADGQVDTAGDDDEAHAQSDDTGVCIVAQDVQPRAAHGAEHAAHGTDVDGLYHALDQHHDDQREDGGEHGVLRPVALEPAQKTALLIQKLLFIHAYSPSC